MARPTFLELQTRYLDLIGDSGGTIDAFEKRNINAAIHDILNRYNWSWALRTTTITLASGVADLPDDFNPVWGLLDARIDEDSIFTIVPIPSRDLYASDNYVAWITYDATTDKYKFNSNTQSGTVTIFYYTAYADGGASANDLSADGDQTIIPDAEAVSTLAASKHWIGAERDNELKGIYQQDAERLITAMYIRDLNQGAFVTESAISIQLTQTNDSDWSEGDV